MAKLDATTLQAIVAAERDAALGAMTSSKLTEERSRALDYYMGEMPDMVPPDGRSKAVSTDVLDTVEGMMPQLMEIFTAGENVVEFAAVGQEDEPAAKQETDYVNHVFMQRNPGFLTLYSMIKDALLSKVGIVKVFWEDEKKTKRERFVDQSDDVYALLMSEPGVTIAEHEEGVDAYGMPMHSFVVEQQYDYGCAKVMAVPPEEFLISRKARSLRDATFAGHILNVTEAELIAQGWDEAQVKALPTKSVDDTTEDQSRSTVEDWQTDGDHGLNRGARLIDVCESYVKCDYHGDGSLVIVKLTTAGPNGEILKKGGKASIEEVECIPFAAMTPVIVTHRFFGRSMADLVLDIQRIKTALLRALLDNAYMANNQRFEVAEAFAGDKTLDDLLANRPGGIVRTRQPGGIVPIPNNPIGPFVFPLLDYVDGTREFRTGVTKQGMGLDANALQNQSATAVSQMFSVAQAKIRLIARIFAETGIKDLFWLLHGTIRRHASQADTVKLRNKWVPIDPREWRQRDDLTISVGLGTGSKAEQLQSLMMILNMQKEALASGLGLAKPEHLYNTATKIIELAGLKSPEPYFAQPDPNAVPPPPPPDPRVVELQMKAQMDAQKMQMASQIEAERASRQSDTERMQAEADIEVQRQKTASEMALAQQKFEFEKNLKLLEFELKQTEAARQASAVAQGDDTAALAAQQEAQMQEFAKALQALIQELSAQSAQQQQVSMAMLQALTAPKAVVFDPKTGRPIGVETKLN
jgi:hypothetical protein